MFLTDNFKVKFKVLNSRFNLRFSIVAVLMLGSAGLLMSGCRRDMQDQPKYEAYEGSDFFKDGIGSRRPPENVVARGFLRDDTHRFAGKMPKGAQQSGGGQVGGGGGGAQRSQQGAGSGSANEAFGQQTGGDTRQTGGLAPTVSDGTQRPSDNSQPMGSSAAQTPADFDADLATTFPFPINKRDLDEGQRWFNGMCSMCHGMTGFGDGMVVKRGYRKPSSYHEPRLRDAPVGHFFDVITNGWGSMPGYGAQVPPDVRWKIIAYVRALQLSQQATLNDVPVEQRSRIAATTAAAARREGQTQQQ